MQAWCCGERKHASEQYGRLHLGHVYWLICLWHLRGYTLVSATVRRRRTSGTHMPQGAESAVETIGGRFFRGLSSFARGNRSCIALWEVEEQVEGG